MSPILTWIFSGIVLVVQYVKAKENSELLFVQILFRHGDRSPISLYPTDPNPKSVWSEGLGKLSMLGRRQHFALGKYLHSRYEGFSTFSPMEVDVLTSEVDRCMKSALTDLASFFAPNPSWEFDDKLVWQPISVHYRPKYKDKYLETGSDCPRADEEEKNVVNSPEGQKFLREHMEMLKDLSYNSGTEIANWTTASYLYDTLMIEKKYNLTIPSWVEPYWEELSNVSALSFFWSFNSHLLQRLRAGPLLEKIIENMRNKLAGNLPHLKFQIFSGHDTNIAVVLDALDLFNMLAPPYCSALAFELHRVENGSNTIRLLYFNSSEPETQIEEPHLLLLKGCSEYYCPLDYFVSYTKDLIPADWDHECQLDKSIVDKLKEKEIAIGWVFIFVAIVVVAVSVYTIWRLYSQKQNKYAYHLMPLS